MKDKTDCLLKLKELHAELLTATTYKNTIRSQNISGQIKILEWVLDKENGKS